MTPGNIANVNATGDVTTTTTWVRSVVLTAGNANATLTLRAGGAGGDIKLTLAAPANTSAEVKLHEGQFTGGVHATLAGTGASATLAYV